MLSLESQRVFQNLLWVDLLCDKSSQISVKYCVIMYYYMASFASGQDEPNRAL